MTLTKGLLRLAYAQNRHSLHMGIEDIEIRRSFTSSLPLRGALREACLRYRCEPSIYKVLHLIENVFYTV